MKIENKPYNSNYFDKIIDLLKETWDFTLHFNDLENSDVLYSLYFKKILSNCSYRRIVIDENDQVLGVIFAEMNERSNKFKLLQLNSKIVIETIKGNFGRKKTAFLFFKQYLKECKALYTKSNFDNEIFLLMISPHSKGMGLGRILVGKYIIECRKNKVKKIGLQTGADCDYHFYDHLGFKRESAMYTDMYIKGNEKENFFIYTKEA